ncbi:DUF2585 family protein [bacterium]|nr:DUF2585 family protein [bacterium]
MYHKITIFFRECTHWLTGYFSILGSALVLLVTIFFLSVMHRPIWCACGDFFPWAGEVLSPHNSQHFFDPYSLTHLLHGFLICWLLGKASPRGSWWVRLWMTVALESGWELLENSEFIIQRYRTTTFSLGYTGDSIANSIGDILFCILGFILSGRIGFGRSLVLLLAIEIILLIWIKDSLLLNIILLIYPVEFLKTWQLSH